MAEIEEELILLINSETIRLQTSAEGDRVIIENVNISASNAATFAWLANHEVGTVLQLELRVI
jgi:hypothetical protein